MHRIYGISFIIKPLSSLGKRAPSNLQFLSIFQKNGGKRPLQGTRLFVRIAISRSRGLSMMRHPMTPAALHPNPMHMHAPLAVAARPFTAFF